jgi:hypothetical protein
MAKVGTLKNVEIWEEYNHSLPCCRCGNMLHLQYGFCPKCNETDPFYFNRYSKKSGARLVGLMSLLIIILVSGLWGSMGILIMFISSIFWIVFALIIENIYKKKRVKYKKSIERQYNLNADEQKTWNYYISVVESKSKIF